MAKTFDPSTLPPADQAAFSQWQQQLQQYVSQNGGAIPASVSYALAHPDYLQSHPELRDAYNIVSGATLPPSTLDKLKDFHPVWSGDNAGSMQENSKLWNKWETWLQIGLGVAVASPVVLPALGVGGGATVPALGGGGTLAANLGGAGALSAGGAGLAGAGGAAAATSAYGPLAGGYGAATTSAAVPASLAAEGGTAAATGGAAAATGASAFWNKLFPELVGIGANTAGSIIQSREASKAAEAEQKAAADALALQSNIYQQQRSDLAPYRNAGSASLSMLSQGLGLPASSDTTTPYFQQQAAQQNAAVPQQAQRNPNSPATTPVTQANYIGATAVPRGSTLSSLAPGQAGMVAMVSPDGRPAQVPQAQVQAALNAGGRLA